MSTTKFPNFIPMNGRVMLFPPYVFDKTEGGIVLTEEQKAKRMLQADVPWEIAAIDPTSGLKLKPGDYVYIDVQSTGDILETMLDGFKVYVITSYAIIAKASGDVSDTLTAAETLKGIGTKPGEA